ncbi:unnamed protein product, partial [Didymodactylos carnosus]
MGLTTPNMDDNDNDDDLEAELRKIQEDAGDGQTKLTRKTDPRPIQDLNSFHMDVSKLLAGIEKPINDEDLSDEDDPDVLAELNGIYGELANTGNENSLQQEQQHQKLSTGHLLPLLEERKTMYEKVIINANNNNEAARARRLERQLKVIQQLLQSVKTGIPINEDDIPPELLQDETLEILARASVSTPYEQAKGEENENKNFVVKAPGSTTVME